MAAGPPKFSWMIFLAFRFIWRKKFFFSTPPSGAALLGGGWNPHFGGLLMSHRNETFHSLFLCYPGNFGKKKFFFSTPLSGTALLGGGGNPHFGGVNVVGSKRNFP